MLKLKEILFKDEENKICLIIFNQQNFKNDTLFKQIIFLFAATLFLLRGKDSFIICGLKICIAVSTT